MSHEKTELDFAKKKKQEEIEKEALKQHVVKQITPEEEVASVKDEPSDDVPKKTKLVIDNQEVVNVYWFTHLKGSFGLVIAKDIITEKNKVYFKNFVSKQTPEEDIRDIVSYGNKLEKNVLEEILSYL